MKMPPPIEFTTEVTIEQIKALANSLRPFDIQEIQAVGLTAEEAVERNIRASREYALVLFEGKPVLVFGVIPKTLIGRRVASPWVFCSQDVERIPRTVAAGSKRFIQKALDKYERLENFVFCKNTTAVKWLLWLGAKFEGPEVSYNGEQYQYYFFEK